MKKERGPDIHEIPMTLGEFRSSFNKSMPEGYPKVTEEQLLRFKSEHTGFFVRNGLWSLDSHRKKIIDWLPRNLAARVPS